MKSFILATTLLSIPFAYSFPEVVAKPLAAGCSSYPDYDENTGIAGPWTVRTVDNENPAIEGFSNTDVYSVSYDPRVDRKPKLRWGHITIPTRNDIAKTPLQCSSNTLTARVATDLTQAGAPTNVQWSPLSLAPYPYDAGLMYKISDGVPVKLFEHYINGTKQDGHFLGGYESSTTWGFTYYPRDQGSSGQDYYYIRLLGPNSADPTTGMALGANETRGFIRINNL